MTLGMGEAEVARVRMPGASVSYILSATFTAASFLGAFLLFLVEPMVAKMLLPSLGGSPAVWNTAMVFFQATLLLGYAFAHVTLRLLSPRGHAALQIGDGTHVSRLRWPTDSHRLVVEGSMT